MPTPDPHSFATHDQWRQFVCEFESYVLPKKSWTHAAHLTVGLWFIMHNVYAEDALDIFRIRLRRYNKTIGIVNTADSGYHETLTRIFMAGIHDFMVHNVAGKTPVEVLQALLKSELADTKWPLKFYSRERINSAEARKRWVEPDLGPNPFAPKPTGPRYELRRLGGGTCVIEVSGGTKPTRLVITDVHFVPPTSELADWVQTYDECSADEAREQVKLGRDTNGYQLGSVLLMDGKPVMVTRDENATIEELLKKLR